MIIKKYLVSNMNEALSRIRNELGKNAVIISQRKVRKEGVKGFFSPKLIEVTAAVENSKKIKNTDIKEEIEMKNSIDSLKKLMEVEIEQKKKDEVKETSATEKYETKEIDTKEEDNIESLKNEISEIKSLLNKALSDNKDEKDYLLEVLEELDLCKSFYEEFKGDIGNINNKDEIILKIRETLGDKIKVCSEEIRGRVVLVGPTGVGKTTTIAKLAGKLALKEKKKVGLITVDTYRIGAVEQLKTYAEIMDISFKVVLNQKEMKEALEEMKDLDVVLIDSTGRSSKNVMQVRELKSLLSKAEADTTFLVLSATTKNKDLKEIIEGFKELNYNKVILTKLDETSTYGSIYNVQKLSEKPISYVTTGQGVPDDILEVEKDMLLKLIFREDRL